MHRIDTATREEDEFGAGKDGFTAGDPEGGIAPTDLSADWFDDVQENICQFIESAGIALEKRNFEQLRDAIEARIDSYREPKARVTLLDPLHGYDLTALEDRGWVGHGAGIDGYELSSRINLAALGIPLLQHLPTLAHVTKIEVMVKPGAARGAGDRMKAWWFEQSLNFDTSPAVAVYDGPKDEAEDDGTTDQQVIVMSTDITVNAEANFRPVLVVTAGSDAGANQDRIVAVRLTWTDPGPRNY